MSGNERRPRTADQLLTALAPNSIVALRGVQQGWIRINHSLKALTGQAELPARLEISRVMHVAAG